MSANPRIRINPYDEHVIIFGQSGTGKSTFAEYLLKNYLRDKPFWLWDYSDEHKIEGVPSVYGVENLKYKSAVYKLVEGSDDEFEAFCVKAMTFTNLTVVIEEVQEYASKFGLPASLARLVRTGRRRGIAYISISQRPAEIHNAIVSNSHHRFIFRLDLPTDIEYLEKWIRCPKEVIQRLPNYHFYYYSPRTGISQIFKPVKV